MAQVKAVFYARVSTEEERQLNALEKQVQENKDVITSKGWKLIDSYIDEGKSGTTTKRRNEYQRLLADMELDKFDLIVVKDQDRLQRNTKDWYIFVDRLVKNGKKLFLYLDNKLFTPADDALITGIKAIIAEEYSRNLSKKLNNANKRRMERALNGEGVSAMGNGKSLAFKIIDGKWAKDEDEAKLGKLIFDLYLKYDSIRKVRDEINNRGYKNSVGRPFTTESISRVLKNEKAKGIIVLGKHHHDFDLKKIVKRPEEDWIRVEAPELAYVSSEVFDKVQSRLKFKTEFYGTGKARGVYTGSDPLSGKIICGSCGQKLWRRESSHKNKNGEKKVYYHWACSSKFAKGDVICNGTTITTVTIRKIYKRITNNLAVNKKAVKNERLQWLNQLKGTLSDSSKMDQIKNDLDKLEAQRAKLLDAYLEELISKEIYKDKCKTVEIQIEEKKSLLQPVEENEDLKTIEDTINNIDNEIDEYVSALNFEESKVDFLIEHTRKITVLENKDIIIELDLVAGAIIAGKDFLLYVHDSVPTHRGCVGDEAFGEL